MLASLQETVSVQTKIAQAKARYLSKYTVIPQQHARNSLLHDLVLGQRHKSSQGKSRD